MNKVVSRIILFSILAIISAGLIFGLCKLFEAKEPVVKYMGVMNEKYIVCEIYNPSSIHAKDEFANYEIKNTDFTIKTNGELIFSDGMAKVDSPSSSLLYTELIVKGKETIQIKIHFDTNLDLAKHDVYFKNKKINWG